MIKDLNTKAFYSYCKLTSHFNVFPTVNKTALFSGNLSKASSKHKMAIKCQFDMSKKCLRWLVHNDLQSKTSMSSLEISKYFILQID